MVDHIRLFPLREGIRWTYRVHEQILPALRRANIPVEWTDLTIEYTQATSIRPCGRESSIAIRGSCCKKTGSSARRSVCAFLNLGSIAGERKDGTTPFVI